MPTSLKEIRAVNSSLRTKTPSLALTAVFVGGTSGLGLATLRAFAQHIPNPTAIIVGRSRARFEQQLQDLRKLNPNGIFEFIEHEIELIRDIDATSKLIEKTLNGRKIDVLYLSQGYISFAGRENNADGLDRSISLRYYGRVRFTQNLLPFSSPTARFISILAGSQEGKVFEDDMDLERNYSIPNTMSHFATLMTLSYDKLAAQSENRQRTFIHVFPGLASTGLLGKSATGILGYLFRWVVEPMLGLLVASKPEDVGERMLWYGTDGELDAFVEAGESAPKCVTVDDKSSVKEIDVLKGYREKGLAGKVADWEGRVFERATA